MFKTKYYLKGKQGIILGVVKVNEEENVLNWNKVVNLLNELSDENRQLQEEIKRLEKMIWKIQWRFQQEAGIEKAREHYQEIDKEMED